MDEEITGGVPDHKETMDFAVHEEANPNPDQTW